MSQVKATSSKTPARSARPAGIGGRPARKARAGGAEGSAAGAQPELLSADGFRQIGQALNGRHYWQADTAVFLGYSRSQITRYLGGSRDLNPNIASHLQFAITERIALLADCMNLVGMPHAGTPQVAAAIEAIKAALATVPGQKPPKHDKPAKDA